MTFSSDGPSSIAKLKEKIIQSLLPLLSSRKPHFSEAMSAANGNNAAANEASAVPPSTIPDHDFGQFRPIEVLDNSQRAKYVAFLGKYGENRPEQKLSPPPAKKAATNTTAVSSGDGAAICEKEPLDSNSAILLLEKEAFPVAERLKTPDGTLQLDLFDEASAPQNIMHNDIWHKYRLALASEFAFAKATLVHPATERLVAKYRRRPVHLVAESPDDYRDRTEPALAAAGAKHSLKWVQNLLDGTAERDRLVHEDSDPETGFMLHADLKWDGQRIDDLYCLAVCRCPGLYSLRSLGPQHLPLLNNLLKTGREALQKRYGVPVTQLRVFLHYQPSFYHLHAHFTHVASDWPGQTADRAHLVASVIENIRLVPDYYQRATLTFPVKEGESLYEAYRDRLDL